MTGSSTIVATIGHVQAHRFGNGPLGVVIAPGTGIRQRFYRNFAGWLGQSGCSAWTLDYRGIGESAPPSLRGFDATMDDWVDDLAGVIAEARRHCARVVLVGHSFGGQALGLLPRDAQPDAAVLVNSQSGWWGHWAGRHRLGMWALWHGLMPGLSRIAGHLPAHLFSSMEDLPRGVALQWARWGRHPDYILRDPGRRDRYAAVTCPILSYSFSDDDALAPKAAVDALASWYTGAAVERRHLEPADVGQDRMGHYGFFRKPMADRLWPEVLDWLSAVVDAAPVARSHEM